MMCGCRGLWRKCDSPVDVCLQVQFAPVDGEQKGEAPQYIKPPKDVTYEEALETINKCEDHGLVHIPLNTAYGDLICNCCDDCCMVINPMLNRGGGVIWDILTPSRYRAVIDEELFVWLTGRPTIGRRGGDAEDRPCRVPKGDTSNPRQG